MDFSSLVLMEREKETGYLIKELGSYEVDEGAEYITKMFYDGDKVSVYFDTQKDVEEWEFTAIYDLFNEEVFTENGYKIEPADDEYNPTWLVKFEYDDNHEVMLERVVSLCDLIKEEMDRTFEEVKEKEEQYK